MDLEFRNSYNVAKFIFISRQSAHKWTENWKWQVLRRKKSSNNSKKKGRKEKESQYRQLNLKK